MSRYWNDTTVYTQPSAAELKRLAGLSISKAGGGRHGVTTLSSMLITPAGLTAERDMSDQERS